MFLELLGNSSKDLIFSLQDINYVYNVAFYVYVF